MPKYFDIHSHLNFKDYDADREEVIKRLRESETHTIVIGTDLASSKSAVELADKHEGIYAAIGIHPIDDKGGVFDEAAFEELMKHPKVVSIGECGLDFYHAKKEEDFERQKALFLKQLHFAVNHGKPLMIHARNAYQELLEILEPLHTEHGAKLRGNIHFFSGNWEEAQRFHAIGFTTSFTAVITLTSEFDEVVKKSPMNMILSETDAPFVSPANHKGERNEPAYVSEVVKRMAELRGASLEEVRVALVENALRMIM
jgi:TatD DNase family protein